MKTIKMVVALTGMALIDLAPALFWAFFFWLFFKMIGVV